MTDKRCALWYWRYYSITAEVFDDERDAAAAAYNMHTEGHGSLVGVQLADGTLHRPRQWPAYEAYEAELEAERDRRRSAWREREPRERHLVPCPFDP